MITQVMQAGVSLENSLRTHEEATAAWFEKIEGEIAELRKRTDKLEPDE